MSRSRITVLLFVLGCYSNHVTGQSWTKIPGNLVQVSGNLNYIWGVDEHMKIYKCNRPCTGGWNLIDGLLVQLDVDDEFVWGVTQNDDIFVRPVDGSGSWRHIGGKLIHVSASGNGYVWGTNRAHQIFKCKKPCTGAWQLVDGLLKMIDGGEREVCGVTGSNGLFCRPVDGSGRWRYISLGFKYVTTSGPHDIFGITTQNKILRCRKPCIGEWFPVGQDNVDNFNNSDATANALFGVDDRQSIWRNEIPLLT